MTGNAKSSLPGERALSRETETKAVIREFRGKGRPVRRATVVIDGRRQTTDDNGLAATETPN